MLHVFHTLSAFYPCYQFKRFKAIGWLVPCAGNANGAVQLLIPSFMQVQHRLAMVPSLAAALLYLARPGLAT